MNRDLRRRLAKHHPRCPLCQAVISAEDMAGSTQQPLHRGCEARMAQARAVQAQQQQIMRARQAGIWLPGQ